MVARMLTKLKALEGRQRPQLAAFDHAIAACAHGGDLAAATVLLREMRHGAQPSEHSYNHLLAVCAARRRRRRHRRPALPARYAGTRATPPPQSAPAARPPARRARPPAPSHTHTPPPPGARAASVGRHIQHDARRPPPRRCRAAGTPQSCARARHRARSVWASAAPATAVPATAAPANGWRRPRRATRRWARRGDALGGARSPCWGRCACEGWRPTCGPTRRRRAPARAR